MSVTYVPEDELAALRAELEATRLELKKAVRTEFELDRMRDDRDFWSRAWAKLDDRHKRALRGVIRARKLQSQADKHRDRAIKAQVLAQVERDRVAGEQIQTLKRLYETECRNTKYLATDREFHRLRIKQLEAELGCRPFEEVQAQVLEKYDATFKALAHENEESHRAVMEKLHSMSDEQLAQTLVDAGILTPEDVEEDDQ
jgi:hypothetical protein